MDAKATSERPDTAAPPAIELRGISKAFGPVQANKDISIRVMPGSIHGIIGENGAGKSTLMSILYGFYKADAGEIWIDGRRTEITDSQAAIRAGIGMVFQHFKLVQNFTVLENIILGVEEGALLRPSLAKARSELKRLAQDYELEVDPDETIEELSVGHQQRVEILKALYRKADILILDEPTGDGQDRRDQPRAAGRADGRPQGASACREEAREPGPDDPGGREPAGGGRPRRGTAARHLASR